MNILTQIKSFTFDSVIFLWMVMQRFQKYEIDYYIQFDRVPNQHLIAALLFQIDHLNKKGFRIREHIIFAPPDLEYRVVINEGIVFTQQPMNDNILLAIKNQDFFYIYSNFYATGSGEHIIFLYPQTLEQMKETNPDIWSFSDEEMNQKYYLDWFQQIRHKYLNGDMMFNG
jgi:hypothetical protein